MDARQGHWDAVYRNKSATEVSWYEPRAGHSLELIRRTDIALTDAIIDIGGGASVLVNDLLEAGYRDLTVLDVSAVALEKLRVRLGSSASRVTLLHHDVTAFEPDRQYALWHDRAVFHFLIDRADRQRYLAALRRALRFGGHVVISTFGVSGPERCSGLPTVRYDERALGAELGEDFKLVESSTRIHLTPAGAPQQFLHCRFVRETPTPP